MKNLKHKMKQIKRRKITKINKLITYGALSIAVSKKVMQVQPIIKYSKILILTGKI
jgi:hypothetical protein